MSEQDFREIFGKNLSYFLELNQISRADLARMLDVHDSTVHSWIIGEKNPRIKNVDKICQIFGIKRSDLMVEHKDNNENYYFSKETRDIAEKISKDKELKLLFKAEQDVPAEDLKNIHNLLKSLKRKENHEE